MRWQSEGGEQKNNDVNGGGRRIRTYGGSPLNGFQDGTMWTHYSAALVYIPSV